jgi:hypothetical protein
MAHYAFIDENNVVVQVITGVDENVIQADTDGSPVGGSTEAWELFYQNQPWFTGLICKRTSFNNRIRKQYAGIGYTYNYAADVFITPQPYPSWSLDSNFDWQAPKEKPEGFYYWDEDLGEWVEYETQTI